MSDSCKSAGTDITVIIPVYNRSKIVLRTLESLARQTIAPDAVIIVDNGSTDNTAEVIRDFIADKNSWHLISEREPGAPSARNRGLSEVKTEWTMFFDSDDVMLPGHIERAKKTIESNPEADVVGWNILQIYPDGRKKKLFFEAEDVQYGNLFWAYFATQRYIARTDLFRRAGGWRNFKIWNDIELGSRLLSLKPRVIKAAGDVTVHNFAGADSITGPSFVSRAGNYGPTLEAMSETLGSSCSRWIDLKRIILSGDFSREGSPKGSELRDAVLSHEKSWRYRLLWKFAYIYVSLGGRGIARLLRGIM